MRRFGLDDRLPLVLAGAEDRSVRFGARLAPVTVVLVDLATIRPFPLALPLSINASGGHSCGASVRSLAMDGQV